MVPVQRKTRSQTKMGRSHDAITPRKSVRCPNCGDPKLPHAACNNCGYVRPGLRLNLGEEA